MNSMDRFTWGHFHPLSLFPSYSFFWRLARAWRPQHLILIHESVLQFTTVYAIKRRFHLFTLFDRRENNADLNNSFEYCNIFLRAILLCFHFSLDVWNDRHKPFFSLVLPFLLFRLLGVSSVQYYLYRQQTVGEGGRNFLSHKLFQ